MGKTTKIQNKIGAQALHILKYALYAVKEQEVKRSSCTRVINVAVLAALTALSSLRFWAARVLAAFLPRCLLLLSLQLLLLSSCSCRTCHARCCSRFPLHDN